MSFPFLDERRFLAVMLGLDVVLEIEQGSLGSGDLVEMSVCTAESVKGVELIWMSMGEEINSGLGDSVVSVCTAGPFWVVGLTWMGSLKRKDSISLAISSIFALH